MFSEAIAGFLTRYFGESYLFLTLGLLILPPIALGAVAIYFLVFRTSGGGLGAILGLGAAAWASLCWLTIPYVGGYPNLLPLLFLSWLGFAGPIDSLGQELFVHVVNFIFWPLIGCLAFLIKGWVVSGFGSSRK